MAGLRGEAAIVGSAEWAPKRKPDKLWMGLEAYAELARMALEDAGLKASDVDGVITGTNLMEARMLVPSAIAEYLGIRANFFDVVDLGGATGAAMAWRAAAAIEAGMCETVVCLVQTQMSPPDPRVEQAAVARDWGGGIWGSPQAEFEIPFGHVQGTYGYAMIANRYRYEFGLKEEQLAKIAVEQRFNAQQHPKAVFRGQPITLDDVMNSPMICDPLKLLEIVMPADFATEEV